MGCSSHFGEAISMRPLTYIAAFAFGSLLIGLALVMLEVVVL